MKLSAQQILDPNSGLFLVNKPKEWTSHDVVNFVRRRFGFKKVGHCGTLDPNATGLLILVVGHATKVADFLAKEDKVYRTTMTLGSETDSHDADGEVTAEKPWDHITEERVRETLNDFIGHQEQVPPMVSALKKNGKKLYELARKGVTVEREARKMVINSIDVHEIALPNVDFTVSCSKGTYVRTLCHDIGRELESAAHMTELVRLKSGGFSLEGALEIDTMKTWEREELMEHILPLHQFLADRTAQDAQEF